MTQHRFTLRPATHDVEASVRQALESIRWRDHVRAEDTVFVKPNYATAWHRPGVTTTREVLEATLGALKDRARRVLVGEADGGYASFLAEEAMEAHGLPDICKRTGAEMVNLSADPPVVVEEEVLGRRVCVHLSPRILGKVDVSVSVPVMKTHFVTTVSLGLKNLWGCDADGMRLLRRKYLSRRLALIARKLNVRLVVLDATTALDGYGPIEGDPIPLGMVGAADNVVASDAACARLMGFEPRSIEHIATAARAGLGSLEPADAAIEHDGPRPVHAFHVHRRLRERLIIGTFHNATLAKLVYDSRLTPAVYRAFGKVPKPRKKRYFPPGSG